MRSTNRHKANNPPTNHNPPYHALHTRWAKLRDQYLPAASRGSIWRFSHEPDSNVPEQGWKIHVSATILTASDVFQLVAPFLQSRGTLFKAPKSIYELYKLNSGVLYSYSQVGKFITVYPGTEVEAILIAKNLHQLTRRTHAPEVPFDLKFRQGGCIYYRYGAFKVLEVEDSDGERTYALRDAEGTLVPDSRHAGKPEWISDPFRPKCPRIRSRTVRSPLQTTYRAFRALTQRGRGGVYQALDMSVVPPRFCVLKEGRTNGEVDWDGRDGFWRVRHEGHVLAALLASNVKVPRLYSSFQAERNRYLAMEFIEGETLVKWLSRKKRRVSMRLALRYSIQLALLLARIHAAGWVWRDCKPGNIILTRDRELRAIDFEGACPVNQPDPLAWGTRSYVPPEWDEPFRGESRLPEDLYALGVVIYFMLTGIVPEAGVPRPLNSLRKRIPQELRRVVAALLNPDPRRRPEAKRVARRLGAVFK